MAAVSVLERMLSRTRRAVTGGKISTFLWPMAPAVATVFQAVPVHTSMEYFWMRWPALSYSIVTVRLKVTGLEKPTSSVELWEPAGGVQKVSVFPSRAAETSAEAGECARARFRV